jgi:hypothetical protein
LQLPAILRFQAGEILLGDAGREPALVLAQIELAVGLELRNVLELGKR